MTQEQVEKYLARIGYTGSRAITGKTLDALIWANISHVPFENLEVYEFRKVPSLDPEDLYDKIVERRRGGYCFELNTLFGELLNAMGFPTYPVVVRLLGRPGPLRPYAHKGLISQAEGKFWYCDVGYGGPGPKGVVEIRAGEQTVGGVTYVGAFRPHTNDFLIRRPDGQGGMTDVLSFAQRPIEPCDFLPLNYYCANPESSHFKVARTVNLTLPNGSKALTGSHFTHRENGAVIAEKTVTTLPELLDLLREEYGLTVDLPEDTVI